VDNSARIWDVRTGGELLHLARTGFSAAATISGDGKWVLTGGGLNSSADPGAEKQDWAARLFNGDTGELEQELTGHSS